MRPSGTAAAPGSGPNAGELAFVLVDWRKSDLVAVDGSVLERWTPSFGYRLAVDLGDADLRRQTAEVSRAPTIPQRVPDASVYRRLSRTRGSAAPSLTISATAPFDGCPARLRRALSLRHIPGGPTLYTCGSSPHVRR